MDQNPHSTSARWIVVLIFVSALTWSRLARSSANNRHASTGTHSSNQPQVSAVKQQQSAAHRPVLVKCHPDSMELVVQADMFDTGIRVDAGHLRLGPGSGAEDGSCRAVPSGEAEFTIWSHLMDCGTKLSSTSEKIIYSNVLVYSPESSPDPWLRLDGASIPVECHYEKKYAVDSFSLLPTWVPHVSIISAEDQIDFNLRLMTDDWKFERGSSSYFLGDPIHFEVSAILGSHMPLRVYVDHCVATATPDAEATVKYDFIEHHGCLTDAYQTNSSSRFLPRVEQHKLTFQLDAFRFYQEPRNQVYISCHVKAVPVTVAVSSQNKACSLIENRWRSVDGDDQACRGCDISRPFEEPPPTEPTTSVTSNKAWPAVVSPESSVHYKPAHHPASYIRFRPRMHQSQQRKPHQSSAGFVTRESDNRAEKTMQLGPLIVHKSSKSESRPTGFRTVLSTHNRTTRDTGDCKTKPIYSLLP